MAGLLKQMGVPVGGGGGEVQRYVAVVGAGGWGVEQGGEHGVDLFIESVRGELGHHSPIVNCDVTCRTPRIRSPTRNNFGATRRVKTAIAETC